jgi:hypothetical protein
MHTRLIRGLPRVAVACLIAVAAASSALSAEMATQKNTGSGVTVAVTPQNVSPEAKTWDFRIVLDTHSQDLKDDLVKATVLLDGSGARQSPLSWDGAGPGGHHRAGVLRFRPPAARPQVIELQIQRTGEPTPRTFRWKAN